VAEDLGFGLHPLTGVYGEIETPAYLTFALNPETPAGKEGEKTSQNSAFWAFL
jgi:hypothetical protein